MADAVLAAAKPEVADLGVQPGGIDTGSVPAPVRVCEEKLAVRYRATVHIAAINISIRLV
ncbi:MULTISPECIES: hypothetical protein [unclassified Saccharothrix]|uniref:hypothetical protein n=1 Tax=unclassified Saccharothrix TaxID=2593673 RepID=UPI00307CD5F6